MVRYVLGVLIGVAVLVVLFGERGDLVAARHEFGHLAVGWLAAAVLAEGASLSAFGFLQHRVLHLAGSRVALPGLVAVSLANEAIANTVPAGPALSCVYRYRFYRQRGASEASSGWTIFTVLIAQAISMSLVLLIGVLVAMLAAATIRGAGVAAIGLVIVVGGGAVLVRRDLVLRLVAGLVRGARRVTGHPREATVARVEAALARMQEIPLGARSTAAVVTIASACGPATSCACCAASPRFTPRFPGTACCSPTARPRWSARCRSCPGGSASSRAASRSSWPPTASRGFPRSRPRLPIAWSASGSRSRWAGSALGGMAACRSGEERTNITDRAGRGPRGHNSVGRCGGDPCCREMMVAVCRVCGTGWRRPSAGREAK